jgi:membrane fusion protein (multidrug efflux system)
MSVSKRHPQTPAMERHRGQWIVGGMIALAIVTVVVLLVRHRNEAHAAPEPQAEAAPLELAPADVAQVQARTLSRSLPISGTLTPLLRATIKAQVAGDVLEVVPREGQTVKKDEVLVRIDPRQMRAALDSQQATLEKARADLQLATQNRDNSRALLEQHFISQNAYDSTVNAYSAAVANVRLAEAQVRLAQLNLDYSVIRAPFDGTIAKRLVEPGEKVSPDSPLLALVDLTKMELQAAVPASEIPNVRVGQHASFKVSGFGDRRFDGEVRRINPVADESSRSIMVYLAVANPDSVLKGGMFAQAELTLDRADNIPSIPLAAVHGEPGASYVLALREGAIARVPVTLGLSDPEQGFVEVREGLRADDRVVVAKLEGIKPGTPAVMAGEGGAHAAVLRPAPTNRG